MNGWMYVWIDEWIRLMEGWIEWIDVLDGLGVLDGWMDGWVHYVVLHSILEIYTPFWGGAPHFGAHDIDSPHFGVMRPLILPTRLIVVRYDDDGFSSYRWPDSMMVVEVIWWWGVVSGGGRTCKKQALQTCRTRAKSQQIVAHRLLSCLQHPVLQLSHLQKIYLRIYLKLKWSTKVQS